MNRLHPSIRAPAKPQGVVGVIGIGGAAIRAGNKNGVGAQFRLCLKSLRKFECLEL